MIRGTYKPYPETRARAAQNVMVDPELLHALDDWRRERFVMGERVSRSEALEYFAWRGMRE